MNDGCRRKGPNSERVGHGCSNDWRRRKKPRAVSVKEDGWEKERIRVEGRKGRRRERRGRWKNWNGLD